MASVLDFSGEILRELSEIKASTDKLRNLLSEIANNIFNGNKNIIYWNIGFILPEILNVYPDLEKITSFRNKNGNSTEIEYLENTLNALFSQLLPEQYLYKLVQKKNLLEIGNKEQLQEILNDLSSNDIKNGYYEIFNKFSSYYLTIYYENTFVIDTLIIATKCYEFSQEFLNSLKIFLQYLAGYLMYQVSRLYALRSAVAAVMARNMSHNIGSHVLTNVSTTTGVLNQQDVKILERFLQNRMDFIAQVSTDFPEWSFPFWFYRNLMRDFYMQHLLLKYIASSEGLKPWSYDDTSTNENGQLKIVVKVNGKNIDNSNDILVSIPGGVVGQHAFCVILEDIIRNAAKHGYATQNNKDSNLEITIEIEDNPENDYIEVCIYDNVSLITCNNSDDYNKDYPDNFATVDISKLPLHQRMNVYLMKSIIDETGQLRKENWGLAEMKISAGYLQKRKIKEIGQEGEEVLKIIKAVAKENNGRYYLGYQFKMLKPKDVLIVGYKNQSSNYNPQQNSIFLCDKIPEDLDYEFCVLCDNGSNDLNDLIKNLSSPDKTKEKNDILTKIEKFPYRLFIATDDNTQLNIPAPLDKLDKRIVLIKKSDIKIDNKDNAENFKLYLYKKWLEHLAKNRDKNLNNVSILVKVTDGDVSGGTREIDEIFKDVKNLNITDDQKKQIGKNLGLSENYAPPTLPPNLRVPDRISQEPWENMNDDLGVKLESPPRSSTNINLSCSKNFIIYARHKYLESINPSPSYLYFESLSGASPHFILISNPPQDKYQKKKLLYQLVENGLIRIGICDERFLQSSILITPTYPEGTEYHDYLRAGQIYPIGKFLDYQIPNIGPDCVVFIEKSNENFEINFYKKNNENQKFKKVNNVAIDIDFLIIHQGILDKLKKSKEEIEGILQKLKTKIPYIIVTSGRGTPPNIPTNVKFLPFSNIESTLLMKPHSKFILTQILMSL